MRYPGTEQDTDSGEETTYTIVSDQRPVKRALIGKTVVRELEIIELGWLRADEPDSTTVV